ncbi:hypothetical protein CJP72_17660 [Citrobacter sp. NCU1]|nr:hypothetical protein [Citrobacter sp. NCU1]
MSDRTYLIAFCYTFIKCEKLSSEYKITLFSMKMKTVTALKVATAPSSEHIHQKIFYQINIFLGAINSLCKQRIWRKLSEKKRREARR